ncbi:4Fe-4S cluster-binding domain-containing protein [Patescibacteria group bacterium]
MPIEGYSKHDEPTLHTVEHNREVMLIGEGDLRFEFAFIDLIAKCQFDCRGCFNQVLNDTGVSLRQEELRSIVDFLKERGGRNITFAGSGEPLLDPELLPLIEYAHDKGINSILFSSLTTVNEANEVVPVSLEMVEALNKLDVHIVAKRSCIDNEKQAEILGVPNTDVGDKMNLALQSLIDAGFAEDGRLFMDCPIDRYTINEIPQLLRFCRERGILPYFESYIIHGQDKETQKEYRISTKELGLLFQELARIDQEEFGIDIELGKGMRIYHADACLKPEYGFAVKANGDVRSCPTDATKAVGNIKESALGVILSPNNAEYRAKFGKFGCCAVLKI